jgi:hypothetical protein
MMTQPKQELYGPQQRDELQRPTEQDSRRRIDDSTPTPSKEDAGRDFSVLLHLGLM